MNNTDDCNVKICFLKLLEVLQNIKTENDANNISIDLLQDDNSSPFYLSLNIGFNKIKLTENDIKNLEDDITSINNIQQNNDGVEKVEEVEENNNEQNNDGVEEVKEKVVEEQNNDGVKKQVIVEENNNGEEIVNDVTTTFDPNLRSIEENKGQQGGGTTSDIFINRFQASERYSSSREEQRGGNIDTTINSITELRERSSLNLNLLRKHQKGGRINNYGINSTSTSSVCE
jgi:hypothetical protein